MEGCVCMWDVNEHDMGQDFFHRNNDMSKDSMSKDGPNEIYLFYKNDFIFINLCLFYDEVA